MCPSDGQQGYQHTHHPPWTWIKLPDSSRLAEQCGPDEAISGVLKDELAAARPDDGGCDEVSLTLAATPKTTSGEQGCTGAPTLPPFRSQLWLERGRTPPAGLSEWTQHVLQAWLRGSKATILRTRLDLPSPWHHPPFLKALKEGRCNAHSPFSPWLGSIRGKRSP